MKTAMGAEPPPRRPLEQQVTKCPYHLPGLRGITSAIRRSEFLGGVKARDYRPHGNLMCDKSSVLALNSQKQPSRPFLQQICLSSIFDVLYRYLKVIVYT